MQAVPAVALVQDIDLSKEVKIAEAQTRAPLISREVFLSRAVIGPAYLSPDGKYAIHLERMHKRVSVVLSNSVTGQTSILFKAKNVTSADWAPDNRHIYFNVGDGIAVSDIKSSAAPKLIFKFEDRAFDRMLGIDPRSAKHFFVSKFDRHTKEHVLLKIDGDGDGDELYRSDYRYRDLLVSQQTNRLFLSLVRKKNPVITELENGEVSDVLICDYDEACTPVYYNEASDELTVAANMEADLGHLVTLDLTDQTSYIRHTDPRQTSDLTGFEIDPISGIPLIAQYQYGFKENYGLTPAIAAHTAFIEETFGPRASLSIQSRTKNAPWLVTAQYGHRREREHFFYDPASKIFRPIAAVSNSQTSLGETVLANRVPFTFEASDGVTIHAYLTLPRGVKASAAPLITLPHGGPWARDEGSFNLFAQFLANRGYIVYQPNFRSSEGFGRKFIDDIDGDFGDGRVQDDIIDGLQYLLENGIGNKEQLGIFGHSFGGFSVLNGLTFTPGLFKVGIAGAPPADLSGTFLRITTKGKFLRHSPLGSVMFSRRLGDIADSQKMQQLHENSPLFHASKVTKPLLIIAGKRDDRVSSDEVLEYALKLEKLEKKVSLIMAEDEGHSYLSEIGRHTYFYLLEKTLSAHLNGRFEPLSKQDKISSKIKRFITKNTFIDEAGLLKLTD
jgi:dipeptidyl aminopeptidase/acylaminoacyl peptidase